MFLFILVSVRGMVAGVLESSIRRQTFGHEPVDLTRSWQDLSTRVRENRAQVPITKSIVAEAGRPTRCASNFGVEDTKEIQENEG